MPELWLAFGAGLLSSMHCVGMCGPLVAGWQSASALPVQIEFAGAAQAPTLSIGRVLVIPQVLYHAGRVVSYTSIGMIAGSLGTIARISPSVQESVTIAFGVLMIVSALFQLNIFGRRKKEFSNNKVYSILRSFVASRSTESRFMIGLLTPLLPCGLLYGMALHSATTNSPVLGAIEMGSFALGAVPALFAVAALSHSFSSVVRKRGTMYASVFIIAMGILTVLRGAGVYHDPFARSSDTTCCAPNHQVLEHQSER